MEENKTQSAEDQQSKEEKKILARYERSLRQLTALMGPDWAKTPKIQRASIPELVAEIVKEKQEEVIKKFKVDYAACVEEKKKLDKTIADKTREFNKTILEAKKEFLKKVDAAMALIAQIDLIEREYAQTLGGDEVPTEQTSTSEPPNQ